VRKIAPKTPPPSDEKARLKRKRDPPPKLSPEERPTPEELTKLAHKLLSETAKDDPWLANMMRERGIPPDWD
jgi:hypothetical protein